MQGNMDPNDIEKLRIASNQFYMNKYLDKGEISDKEFDKLRQEYEHETGRPIFDLVEWEGEKRKNTLKIHLDKLIVESNDLASYAKKYMIDQCHQHGYYPNTEGPESEDPENFNTANGVAHYFNYKYDGCSILGIYENGILKEVRSTPDERYGILRTKAFVNIFPNYIDDKEVVALQGEALVDYRAYGQLARNKANGLVNSIYKDAEVGREIFIRIYKAYYTPEVETELSDSARRFYRQLRTLDSLPRIMKNRERMSSEGMLKSFDDIVFAPAERFIASQSPKDALVTPHGWDYSAYFQVDGIVLYSEYETKAMKFYYTESAITTVTNIEWNIQPNGGWAPKVQFNQVRLNDKNISQASSGGVPNMINMRFGIGSKVKIILANMTIPKIIEVIEPSTEYNWPVCDCGYKISEKDIFGSSVKCQSLNCDRRSNQWYNSMNAWWTENDNWHSPACSFSDYPYVYLNISLQIDRWIANKNKRVNDDSALIESVINSMGEGPESFLKVIMNHFNFSSLQLANLRANYGASFNALKRFLDL